MPDKPVQHYLITLHLMPRPTCLHAYMMTNDPGDIEKIARKMVAHCEDHYGPPMLPAILATTLSTSLDDLRREIWQVIPESEDMMKKATTFHVTMWELAVSEPWNERLLALH